MKKSVSQRATPKKKSKVKHRKTRKTNPSTRVRAKKKNVKDEMVFARVDSATKALYSRIAKRQGFTKLSDWIREVLNAEAGIP